MARVWGQIRFWRKPLLAAGLAGLADLLFWGHGVGANLAVMAAVLVLAAVLGQPAMRRAWPLALGALGFGLWQAETPSLIGWLFFMVLLGGAVLATRTKPGEDVWRRFQRLVVLGLGVAMAPLRVLRPLAKARMRKPGQRRSILGMAASLVLPVGGGLLFLALFSAANPLIAKVLFNLQVPRIDVPRVAFWIVGALLVFAMLRPSRIRKTLGLPGEGGEAPLPIPGVNAASVILSLIVFNALFGLQNGLDLAYLWSGAGLPDGMTLADYAHRGAYPLIVTALLAGLFVLVALAPGTPASRRPLVRWLVILWVAQNVLLVASTILRTVDYIEVYSLTRLRIAALAWMGLVAVGLVLICWRMLTAKSAAWLLNANALCAGLVLTAFVVFDSGSVAAAWNVRHAREVGGKGAALDVCYLSRLGPSALISMARLEQEPLPDSLRARVAGARRWELWKLDQTQSHWRTWTWRGQRRLDAVRAIRAASSPQVQAWDDFAGCDAPVVEAPEAPPAASNPPPNPPLTPAPASQ